MVGEQQHVAQLGDLPVKLLDPGAGNVQQFIDSSISKTINCPEDLMFYECLLRHHAGRAWLRGVELVLVQAAQPGAPNHGLSR